MGSPAQGNQFNPQPGGGKQGGGPSFNSGSGSVDYSGYPMNNMNQGPGNMTMYGGGQGGYPGGNPYGNYGNWAGNPNAKGGAVWDSSGSYAGGYPGGAPGIKYWDEDGSEQRIGGPPGWGNQGGPGGWTNQPGSPGNPKLGYPGGGGSGYGGGWGGPWQPPVQNPGMPPTGPGTPIEGPGGNPPPNTVPEQPYTGPGPNGFAHADRGKNFGQAAAFAKQGKYGRAKQAIQQGGGTWGKGMSRFLRGRPGSISKRTIVN